MAMCMRTSVHGIHLSRKTVLTLVLAICAASSLASNVHAASAAAGPSASNEAPNDKGDDSLAEVVVTGSLIPQAKAEDFTPITTISSEDIQARGFADIAEALQ